MAGARQGKARREGRWQIVWDAEKRGQIDIRIDSTIRRSPLDEGKTRFGLPPHPTPATQMIEEKANDGCFFSTIFDADQNFFLMFSHSSPSHAR